jgi:hypothetical protein
MNKVQLLNHTPDAIVTTYQVRLVGAFEGDYRVVVIRNGAIEEPNRIFAFAGTTEIVYITNKDIINLLDKSIVDFWL